MRTNTLEAVLSAYIASIGKRTPRDAALDGGWGIDRALGRRRIPAG